MKLMPLFFFVRLNHSHELVVIDLLIPIGISLLHHIINEMTRYQVSKFITFSKSFMQLLLRDASIIVPVKMPESMPKGGFLRVVSLLQTSSQELRVADSLVAIAVDRLHELQDIGLRDLIFPLATLGFSTFARCVHCILQLT